MYVEVGASCKAKCKDDDRPAMVIWLTRQKELSAGRVMRRLVETRARPSAALAESRWLERGGSRLF